MPAELAALFVLGLLSGATVCGLACLGHLGPYVLASCNGFRQGLAATYSYLGGKLLVYILWGGTAGWLGSVLLPAGFSRHWVGLLLIASAALLPVLNRRACPPRTSRRGTRATLFSLGMATSLLPCPTIGGLLGVAAGSGSALVGAAFGAAFGLGLVCSPLAVAGGGLGFFSGRLGLELGGIQKLFQIFAMLVLVGMGLKVLLEV